jgi:hypothetical protein
MPEQYCNVGNAGIIKKQIYLKLDENPLLSPKEIAKLLDLPYKQYRNYITKTRSNWKYYHENERGSKCSSFHCYKAKTWLDKGLSDGLRCGLVLGGSGWFLSRAKNRFLIFKDRLGRVVWFETGSVRLFVKKPGNLGKAKQLFCNAFVNSGVITDVAVWSPIVNRVSPKSCHFPYVTPQRLPYVFINDFAESHGIVIKVGDRSHPNAVEVIAEFTSKQDEIERKVSAVFEVFNQVNGVKKLEDKAEFKLRPLSRGEDYSF